MSLQLINHSEDLKRLQEEGFEIEVRDGYLIVHHVPYVNRSGEVNLGKLIAQLTIVNGKTAKPNTHVIHFMGEAPCHKTGGIIMGIQHSSPNTQLFDGIVMNYSFSNKPKGGYNNHYDQVVRYSEIISAPAISMNPAVTARTFKQMQNEVASVFNYYDTNASRSNILPMLRRFGEQCIGIVGIGGTGSYILDLVAKVPVQNIHIFDGDWYRQHNGFRSPGASTANEFDVLKVDHFGGIYSRVHSGIVKHTYFIDESNLSSLDSMSLVFVSVDNNEVRKLIIDYLREKGIPLIDVGLGINTLDDSLIGTVRVTVVDAQKNDHILRRVPLEDTGENEYAPNIQIADLNMLAAALAVLKWKKLTGFYQDLEQEYNSTYTVNVAQLCNDEHLLDEDSEEDAA